MIQADGIQSGATKSIREIRHWRQKISGDFQKCILEQNLHPGQMFVANEIGLSWNCLLASQNTGIH